MTRIDYRLLEAVLAQFPMFDIGWGDPRKDCWFADLQRLVGFVSESVTLTFDTLPGGKPPTTTRSEK